MSIEAIQEINQRLLGQSRLTSRFLESPHGARIHLVEGGDGPPLVVIHGTGNSGTFLMPLLERLDGVRILAIDRPGFGLSDPAPTSRDGFRSFAVEWINNLLDQLGLERASLLGHSMGGLWSTWYGLAHPERVERLVLVGGAPALTGMRPPLPFRLMATPGIGELIQRRPTTRKSVLQFARFVGEGETLPDHLDLVDLMIASGDHPTAPQEILHEVRSIITPFAIIARSGWRRRMRVEPSDLAGLGVPTLLVWGERETLGSVEAARRLEGWIPNARLHVAPGGHAPWLGSASEIAAVVSAFVG